MRTIIAGSRGIINVEDRLSTALRNCSWLNEITCVLSGGARGVDQFGEEWARSRGIPFEVFPANWDAYGKGAGPIRNRQMAESAQALIALWDGESRGTKNMIDTARRLGLRVHVAVVPKLAPPDPSPRTDNVRRRAQTAAAGARCANHPQRPAVGYINGRARCKECLEAIAYMQRSKR